MAAATGVPTEGVTAPTELPVHRISLNPDNPRSTLGDLTDLAGSLKTHGQKQAITIMNRDAYVKANPGQEAALEPDTTHVVVDGSSRLAAAREAGLATIKVMVSDDQGGTSEELLESALVANIHRQDLDEIDEARALQRLLAIHGSQRALAKRLHRSQGWVSQRLALLNLTPELQARIGEEPIDLLRAVGNKPAEQQQAALEEMKAERTRKEEARTRAVKGLNEQTAEGRAARPEASLPGDYGVITGRPDRNGGASEASPAAHHGPATSESDADPSPASSGPAAAGAPQVPAPVATEAEMPAHGIQETSSVPVQTTASRATSGNGDRQQLKRFPYEDGVYAAQLLSHKMPPEEFNKMLDLLLKHRDSQSVPAS
ncbi:plasmid partitioning protein [Streptomyces bungoensis]|uniref:Plasmid partitioning protein n=1 Tax=Streptomyces bungoensis TaxID=285568 RepID=A0A101SPM0_9ACTN|nr:plasmid partitioning protein [Streptomyces bungoensis]